VTLARASEVGIEVLGGILARARSAGVTVAVHAASGALPAAAARLAPTPGARAEAVAASSSSAAEPTTTVWAAAALASARARAREALEMDEQVFPEAGDLVDHFAFGKCEVLTSDGDRLRIRDIGGPNRIREVSLAMLNVQGPTEVDGKRLFRLVRKAPGA
jgi:hypothetical protein